LAYVAARAHRGLGIAGLILAGVALVAWTAMHGFMQTGLAAQGVGAGELRDRSLPELFVSGLKAGLLTFGGAYTVIPFLQEDAVATGAWMTNPQFLDGLALSSLLPAPLIIFATFVGYAGGGAWGAVAVTVAIFLPAFAFSLVAHDPLERLVSRPSVHQLLEGVTAGVVGLIAGTGIVLLVASVRSIPQAIVFAAALVCLFRFKSKAVIPLVVAGAALFGVIWRQVSAI
jgi:chromate transporter